MGGRRGIATFAIRAPEASLQRELWPATDDLQTAAGGSTAQQQERGRAASQRAATAAIARRQQWQTVPMDCPKTLDAAKQEPCAQARIITSIDAPHNVVFANAAWEQLCGWSAGEVVGRPGLAFLQGPETDAATVQRINAAVKWGERIHVRLVNYKRDGSAFTNSLRILPLRSRFGELTHVMGILEEVPDAPPGLACQLGGQHDSASSGTSGSPAME